MIDGMSSQSSNVSPESQYQAAGRISPPRPPARVYSPKVEKPRSIGAAIGGDRRVELILAVMKGDMTVVDAARQVGVSETTLNHDRAVFIEAGRKALAERGRGPSDGGALVCSDMKVHALGAAALERYTYQMAPAHDGRA